MERLPSEIKLDILSRLPVETVLDCKLVCKSFLNVLTNKRDLFAKMHHYRQLLQLSNGNDSAAESSMVKTNLVFSYVKSAEWSLTPLVRLYNGDKYHEEMNVHESENFCDKKLKKTSIAFQSLRPEDVFIGSCNGLICLKRSRKGSPDLIYICNPITGEYVDIPVIDKGQGITSVFGFGYIVHSATNYEYKVVRYFVKNHGSKGEVQVYTIGSGRGWRTKCTAGHNFSHAKPVGAFVNGAIHWIRGAEIMPGSNIIEGVHILAFSLADEEFRLVDSLCLHNFNEGASYKLLALGGKLCLFDQSNKGRLDLWSLDLEREGTEDSWSLDFSMPYGSAKHGSTNLFRLMPIFVTKKNELLLVHLESMLYCLDPETNRAIQLWGNGSKNRVMYLCAFPHMNSFISLKALGEDSKMKVRGLEPFEI